MKNGLRTSTRSAACSLRSKICVKFSKSMFDKVNKIRLQRVLSPHRQQPISSNSINHSRIHNYLKKFYWKVNQLHKKGNNSSTSLRREQWRTKSDRWFGRAVSSFVGEVVQARVFCLSDVEQSSTNSRYRHHENGLHRERSSSKHRTTSLETKVSETLDSLSRTRHEQWRIHQDQDEQRWSSCFQQLLVNQLWSTSVAELRPTFSR